MTVLALAHSLRDKLALHGVAIESKLFFQWSDYTFVLDIDPTYGYRYSYSRIYNSSQKHSWSTCWGPFISSKTLTNEDPITPCNRLHDWKLIFAAQNHKYPLDAWSKKMLHIPNSNPMKIGKWGEIQHFLYCLNRNFVLWPKTCTLQPKLSGS